MSHNAANANHTSKPGLIAVCDTYVDMIFYMYLFFSYSFSDGVSDLKHIECSDYFGHHRQVYITSGVPRDLVIVNDVACYVESNPGW